MRAFALLTLLCAVFFLSLSTGSSELGFADVFRWLTGQLDDSTQNYIFSDLRLTRTTTCIVVGASLSLCGYLLQLLLDNPLAEPYTLGLSGGASLGALLGLLLGLQPQWLALPVGGLIGCLVVAVVILLVVLRANYFKTRLLVLFGLMISLFCGALIVVAVSLLEPHQMSTALQWMMGHCGTARDQWWPLCFLVLLVAVGWFCVRARELDTLLLGETLASSLTSTLGRSLRALRIEIILVVSILTAASVSLMGLVGFVGLMAPHLAHFALGSRRARKSLLPTLFIGSTILLLADVVGRLIGGDREIPAGSLVALVGAPFLAWLILRRFQHD